jgi:hypothetical protein
MACRDVQPGRTPFQNVRGINAENKIAQLVYYITEVQRDATTMQSLFYFTAISLYMFRMPFASIIRRT